MSFDHYQPAVETWPKSTPLGDAVRDDGRIREIWSPGLDEKALRRITEYYPDLPPEQLVVLNNHRREGVARYEYQVDPIGFGRFAIRGVEQTDLTIYQTRMEYCLSLLEQYQQASAGSEKERFRMLLVGASEVAWLRGEWALALHVMQAAEVVGQGDALSARIEGSIFDKFNRILFLGKKGGEIDASALSYSPGWDAGWHMGSYNAVGEREGVPLDSMRKWALALSLHNLLSMWKHQGLVKGSLEDASSHYFDHHVYEHMLPRAGGFLTLVAEQLPDLLSSHGLDDRSLMPPLNLEQCLRIVFNAYDPRTEPVKEILRRVSDPTQLRQIDRPRMQACLREGLLSPMQFPRHPGSHRSEHANGYHYEHRPYQIALAALGE